MPRLVSPGGTVVEVGDGPLVGNLKAAGWTLDEAKPEPKKQAPRKRAARKTED